MVRWRREALIWSDLIKGWDECKYPSPAVLLRYIAENPRPELISFWFLRFSAMGKSGFRTWCAVSAMSCGAHSGCQNRSDTPIWSGAVRVLSMVILDGESKEIGTQYICLTYKSRPNGGSHWLIGLQLPWIRHPQSHWIWSNKTIRLAVMCKWSCLFLQEGENLRFQIQGSGATCMKYSKISLCSNWVLAGKNHGQAPEMCKPE